MMFGMKRHVPRERFDNDIGKGCPRSVVAAAVVRAAGVFSEQVGAQEPVSANKREQPEPNQCSTLQCA